MGMIGVYGGVSGAPSALVFAGSTSAPETVGYTGEALVLAATALGLSTCWLGGIFRPDVASSLTGVSTNERVYAASPLGYAVERPTVKERVLSGTARSSVRKDLTSIAGEHHESWPAWARAAVRAARLAPSARNAQPWHFSFGEGSLKVSFTGPELPVVPKRLDCGIAMLHAELGAFGEGVVGTWQLLPSPAVATFTPLG